MTREHLQKLKEMVRKAAISLTDEDALDAVEMFEPWAVGVAYEAQQRIRYGDKLYRCEQAHTSQAGWEPPEVPALWTEVAKPGEIPVWKQPTGAQDAYQLGDRVWYPEKNTDVWVSLVNDNVWEPGTPGLWEKEES